MGKRTGDRLSVFLAHLAGANLEPGNRWRADLGPPREIALGPLEPRAGSAALLWCDVHGADIENDIKNIKRVLQYHSP